VSAALTDEEARWLIDTVEDGGAYFDDVPAAVAGALFGAGLIEQAGDRDFWVASDAGWEAYPAALRQTEARAATGSWAVFWHRLAATLRRPAAP
jgi:hypothetical protein